MATLTISAGGFSKSVTLSAGNVTRILNTYKETYKNLEPPPVTNAEIFEAFANGIFQGIRNNVVEHEKETSRKAAEDGVVPIAFT